MALGVDVTAAGPDSATATADVGEVVGGIADMKADKATYDVLILDNGLILAEKPREPEYGGRGPPRQGTDENSGYGRGAVGDWPSSGIGQRRCT